MLIIIYRILYLHSGDNDDRVNKNNNHKYIC